MERVSRPDLNGAVWRKSSYSNQEGGDCVEVSSAVWRKSSHSNQEGGDCVEVGDGITAVVPVRDSKRPDGPVLVFPAGTWTSFIGELKADHRL
ncbi:putative toxin-antitoxin system, toxin component [Streptomyces himastatinicus ATCC 53653]|uniref:Putative toxin-antitoxin system, toxin component n=1 Tax=Streptomyces himastatinicus ATCC 53653 TaxID=457427 RepID=D9WNC9_9ACTN|nr:putative toxin-antitoxin system, toxin component [Streptomyces himastatinicus ATCC 53653]